MADIRQAAQAAADAFSYFMEHGDDDKDAFDAMVGAMDAMQRALSLSFLPVSEDEPDDDHDPDCDGSVTVPDAGFGGQDMTYECGHPSHMPPALMEAFRRAMLDAGLPVTDEKGQPIYSATVFPESTEEES